ncbi:MAG TPA: DUF4235 domain-containing protein [Longimicrobiales bacterium]|nr:DUF4235 domain-containing protein [Longimicrobiales bacterium]
MDLESPDPKRIIWMGIAAGAAALTAFAVRKGLEQAWRVATDDDPPDDPSSPDVPWRHAIIWAAATGAIGNIGRLLAQRTTEAGWHRVTGETPPL